MILRELTMERPRKCVLKGHIVVQEDIPIFIIREKHLFVSLDPAEIHEEEAATFCITC